MGKAASKSTGSKTSRARARADHAEDDTVPVEAPVMAGPPSKSQAGATRYVVLEEVGRGAMGRVLRAYDPRLQREVALKEVKDEHLGRDAASRLVVEARAMAKLSHPNVVAVFDVEEVSADEYLTAAGFEGVVVVMEYVAGTTLRGWLRERARSYEDIVAAFVAAGRGLAAAHAAGVLHRDFKPANVLVGEDANGGTKPTMVKVTDFGLARTTSEDAASGTRSAEGSSGDATLTATEAVMGTPRYMAPEQHCPGAPLTVAADQYAFCVALWEALTGSPPFSGKQMSAAKQRGAPPWPENEVPRAIVDAIRRGLAAEPRDRWPSMSDLLEAIAFDPARRRSRGLWVAGTVAALGVAAVGVQSWAATRSQRCAGAERQLEGIWDDAQRASIGEAMRRVEVPYAASVEQRTETVLDEYAVTWKRVHTEACEAATVRGEVSSKTMDAQMACLHRAKAELAGVTRVLAEPDETVVGKAHELLAGLSPLEVCADTEVLQADVEPPPVEDAATVATIEKLLADGRAERMAGRHAAARELLQEARTVAEKVEYEPIEMELAFQEGFLLYELGEYEPAEQAYRRAFEAAARSHRRSLMARSAGQLISIVGVKLNRPDEGMSFARIGGGLARGNLRDEALVANGTGTILVMQGDLEGAEAAIRRALEQLVEVQGPDHPGVLRVRTNLGNVLYQQGKYAEAEAEQRRALEGWEASLGPSHPNVATALNNLGSALHAQGKYEDAEVELRRALELREQLLEPNHPALAQSHGNLAGALHGQHEDAKAEVELRRAVEILEKARGAESPEVAQFRNNLAILLRIQGKLEEAETEHRRILDVWRKVFGPVHPLVASSLTNLGLVLHDRGKLEEAEVELAAALQVREQALGTDHPDTAESRTNLARLVLERGRARDAVTLAEMAWTHQQRGDVPPAHRAATAFVLARASWAADADASRSRGWAERALQAHEQAGTIDGEQAAAVREWMRRHLGP